MLAQVASMVLKANFQSKKILTLSNPTQLYAATKKSNEVIAASYNKLYGINTIGLRFFTVYGPWGRPDMAPIKFAKNILKGKPIEVFNKGNHFRDFTFVDDIVNGISKIINKREKFSKNKIYNIGNGKKSFII